MKILNDKILNSPKLEIPLSDGAHVGEKSPALAKDYVSCFHDPKDTDRISRLSLADLFLSDAVTGKANMLVSEQGAYVEADINGVRNAAEIKADGPNPSIITYSRDDWEIASVYAACVLAITQGLSEQPDSNGNPISVKGEMASLFREAKEQAKQFGTLSPIALYQFADAFKIYIESFAPNFIPVDEGRREIIPEVQIIANRGVLTKSFLMEGIKAIPFKLVTPPEDGATLAVGKTQSKFYEEACEGKYIIPWNWEESEKSRIPALSTLKDFEPTTYYQKACEYIIFHIRNVISRYTMNPNAPRIETIGNDKVNFDIYGKPGNGKSRTIDAIAATLGFPVYHPRSAKTTEEDEYEGTNRVSDGKLTFCLTEFVLGWQKGGIIAFEDKNLPDPGVTAGACLQALERPFILMVDGYKPLTRNPMTVVIGTLNVGTNGTKGGNEAFESRFNVGYHSEDPKEASFINIMKKSGYNEKASKYVYDFYNGVIKMLEEASEDELVQRVTFRQCQGALSSMQVAETFHKLTTREIKEALRDSIVAAVGKANPALEQAIEEGRLANIAKPNFSSVVIGKE